MFKYFYALIKKVKSKLNQKGQGMIEYALIIAFVAGIAYVALNSKTGLGEAIQGAFGKAKDQIETQTNKIPSDNNNSGNTGGDTGENTDETTGKTL